MIYRVKAWSNKKLRLERYYRVCDSYPMGIGYNTYCDDFYDFLLHLLLDHAYKVEVTEIDKKDLPEDVTISVL